jgi:Tat protein translocase TatB subunit
VDFFGIGGWEILLILIVALIVLGPGKLPEIARNIGKTVRALRKTTSDLTSAVTRELNAEEERLSEAKRSLESLALPPAQPPDTVAPPAVKTSANPADGEASPKDE